MKRIIKIGFPIVCIAVIGGTFVLLNKTTDKINRNKLKDDDTTVEETVDNSPSNEVIEETVVVQSEEAKAKEIDNKAKAIELVKKLTPPLTNVYYTSEGTDNKKYIVAIRNNDTKDVKIYYSVDVENEAVEVYVKK